MIWIALCWILIPVTQSKDNERLVKPFFENSAPEIASEFRQGESFTDWLYSQSENPGIDGVEWSKLHGMIRKQFAEYRKLAVIDVNALDHTTPDVRVAVVGSKILDNEQLKVDMQTSILKKFSESNGSKKRDELLSLWARSQLSRHGTCALEDEFLLGLFGVDRELAPSIREGNLQIRRAVSEQFAAELRNAQEEAWNGVLQSNLQDVASDLLRSD